MDDMSLFDDPNNKKEEKANENSASANTNTNSASSIKDSKTATTGLAKQSKTEAKKEGELAVDIFSSGVFLIVRALVAGSGLEDIDVSVTQDTLTIKGSRKTPDESVSEGFYSKEIYWGAFSRKIILPTVIDVDKVEATLHNGVLTVKLLMLDRTKEQEIDIKAV